MVKSTFSVRPVRQVAMERKKVMMPKLLWTGTREARNLAVPVSQQSRIRNEKNPTTNWERGSSVRLGRVH